MSRNVIDFRPAPIDPETASARAFIRRWDADTERLRVLRERLAPIMVVLGAALVVSLMATPAPSATILAYGDGPSGPTRVLLREPTDPGASHFAKLTLVNKPTWCWVCGEPVGFTFELPGYLGHLVSGEYRPTLNGTGGPDGDHLAITSILPEGVTASASAITVEEYGRGSIRFYADAPVAPVPLPGALGLMVLGLGVLGAAQRIGRRT